MNHKITRALAAGILTACGGWTVQAAGIPALVNFDPPNSPRGPSIYVAVPGPQTITTTPAIFSGGVLLGFATFFPAIAFASAPNVYGSADFGNRLAKQLAIDINPAYMTTEVSFALFNGETFSQSYVVNAFNGTTMVASQTLANIAPNFNSGYALADVVNLSGITKVTITPTGTPSVWDCLIDSVAFNQNITSVITGPPPPVVQPPAPPVRGHRRGKRKGETELVEVNFGDEVNDIRGSVLVVTTPLPPAAHQPHAGASFLDAAARRVATVGGVPPSALADQPDRAHAAPDIKTDRHLGFAVVFVQVLAAVFFQVAFHLQLAQATFGIRNHAHALGQINHRFSHAAMDRHGVVTLGFGTAQVHVAFAHSHVNFHFA